MIMNYKQFSKKTILLSGLLIGISISIVAFFGIVYHNDNASSIGINSKIVRSYDAEENQRLRKETELYKALQGYKHYDDIVVNLLSENGKYKALIGLCGTENIGEQEKKEVALYVSECIEEIDESNVEIVVMEPLAK